MADAKRPQLLILFVLRRVDLFRVDRAQLLRSRLRLFANVPCFVGTYSVSVEAGSPSRRRGCQPGCGLVRR
jgi:hypothetical protein